MAGALVSGVTSGSVHVPVREEEGRGWRAAHFHCLFFTVSNVQRVVITRGIVRNTAQTEAASDRYKYVSDIVTREHALLFLYSLPRRSDNLLHLAIATDSLRKLEALQGLVERVSNLPQFFAFSRLFQLTCDRIGGSKNTHQLILSADLLKPHNWCRGVSPPPRPTLAFFAADFKSARAFDESWLVMLTPAAGLFSISCNKSATLACAPCPPPPPCPPAGTIFAHVKTSLTA